MDLAFEESLNVKLVLIPDQEDPDSYVRKKGAAAFRDLIAENKKDFILFQLETSLSSIGNDTNRKAALVNQIAETISRISKAEDFTKQQDYIRRSSELLRIDEAGLNNLVNKFVRERIGKSSDRAGKSLPEDTDQKAAGDPAYDEELTGLLNRDEQQERAIIRSLLEFGLRSWDKEKTVADILLPEFEDDDILDNKNLVSILRIYKNWYQQGLEPTARNFLYQEDQELSALVVSIMDFPFEVSENWKTFYEGRIPTRDELYREEVRSTLTYLKLRKIRRLIEMNQKDLESTQNVAEQLMYMQTHLHLKKMEKELMENLGTVIVKM
jgi:DNA primase